MARPTMDQTARDKAHDALDVLEHVMNFGEKDSDRISAAKEILDRGHGRPISATVQIPMTKRAQEALAALSEEELKAVVKSHQLPRLVSAAFSEGDTFEHEPQRTTPIRPRKARTVSPAPAATPTDDDLLA